MLSRLDDYPIQQTSEPLAHPATSDRNFYGRYWFNGFSQEGDFFFGIALGVYPNRQVMDAAFSVVTADGQQESFRASRRVPTDRAELRVGPLSLDVVEPMRVLRMRLAPNETGIEADLTFRARTVALEEPRQTMHEGTRVTMDTTRFTQFGDWEGGVAVDGRRTEVLPDRTRGTRDRSWGVRGVGEREAGAARRGAPQICWLWAPLHFADVCTHFGVFEYADGTQWHSNGAVVPAYPASSDFSTTDESGVERMVRISHALHFVKGTRRMAGGTLELVPAQGEARVTELEPVLRFPMIGIGYAHPEWGHGTWHGELETMRESWNVNDLDELDPRYQHMQQVVRARMGERVGIGVLEQIILGPHERFGFKEFLDGAS
ncbi:MAG: hypothetical protein V3V67_10230 [Myxococcota bacterium]